MKEIVYLLRETMCVSAVGMSPCISFDERNDLEAVFVCRSGGVSICLSSNAESIYLCLH